MIEDLLRLSDPAGVLARARPERPAWLRKGSDAGDLRTPEGRLSALFFIVVDVEIAAAEVCAANIALFPEMPDEFREDMRTQVEDECRHARAVLDRFLALGGRCEDRMYEGGVWDRWSRGKTLAEKLSIEQVLMEGNALDASGALSAAFRAAGDPESAAVFDAIVPDEVRHVSYGAKWLKFLGYSDLIQAVDAVAPRVGMTAPGRYAPAAGLRASAGLALEHTAELARRFKLKEAAAALLAESGKKK